MSIRFKNKSDVFNIVVTVLAAVLSVGIMLYGVWHFGLRETWPELVLNLFYIACILLIWMFFFNRIQAFQFNYWCTVCVGIAVLLRDILFPPHLAYYSLHLSCLALSVLLLLMLTYFYARKDWRRYTKGNLWTIFVVDMLIALLYNLDIILEPTDEFTSYMMVEIWIRPTITYGLVACFVKESQD
ncbi:MAG: hypothetical protein J5478_05360 [Bacteroidales bacterium]|nr:hypothetical protein [Bacteroidales bacterium]